MQESLWSRLHAGDITNRVEESRWPCGPRMATPSADIAEKKRDTPDLFSENFRMLLILLHLCKISGALESTTRPHIRWLRWSSSATPAEASETASAPASLQL